MLMIIPSYSKAPYALLDAMRRLDVSLDEVNDLPSAMVRLSRADYHLTVVVQPEQFPELGVLQDAMAKSYPKVHVMGFESQGTPRLIPLEKQPDTKGMQVARETVVPPMPEVSVSEAEHAVEDVGGGEKNMVDEGGHIPPPLPEATDWPPKKGKLQKESEPVEGIDVSIEAEVEIPAKRKEERESTRKSLSESSGLNRPPVEIETSSSFLSDEELTMLLGDEEDQGHEERK